MKKREDFMRRLLMLLLVFPVLFASCSKDDDNNDSSNGIDYEKAVVGTWKYGVSVAIRIDTNDEEAYKFIESFFTNLKSNETYKLTADKKIQFISLDEEPGTGTYTVNGNKITLYRDNEDRVSTYDIVTIDETGITFVSDETEFLKNRLKISERFPNAEVTKIVAVITFVAADDL